MEIRNLQLIKTIVEEGTLVKASEVLHLTQSALSQQLKQIEYELNTSLFTRTNRKMELTESGKKVYEISVEFYDKWKKTEQEILQIGKGESGEISILTDCHTSYEWLPKLIKTFKKDFPNINLKMGEQFSTNPFKNLQNDIDIIITPFEKKHKEMEYFPLFSDEFVLAVSTKNKLSKKHFIEPKDFENHNLIIYANPLEETITYKYILEPSHILPKKITVVPFTEASIEMVRNNLGISVFAKWAIRKYLKSNDINFIKIGEKGLIRQHYGAILKSNSEKKSLQNFIEFLQERKKI